MFNLLPGQGLGYTASKKIAFGLGFGLVVTVLGLAGEVRATLEIPMVAGTVDARLLSAAIDHPEISGSLDHLRLAVTVGLDSLRLRVDSDRYVVVVGPTGILAGSIKTADLSCKIEVKL